MKRAFVISWLVLCGLTGAFLSVIWLTQPTGTTFWALAKALGSLTVLAAPAARYLRNNRREIPEKVQKSVDGTPDIR
jgi:hypothetical protein